jgi:hypothetical protein
MRTRDLEINDGRLGRVEEREKANEGLFGLTWSPDGPDRDTMKAQRGPGKPQNVLAGACVPVRDCLGKP